MTNRATFEMCSRVDSSHYQPRFQALSSLPWERAWGRGCPSVAKLQHVLFTCASGAVVSCSFSWDSPAGVGLESTAVSPFSLTFPFADSALVSFADSVLSGDCVAFSGLASSDCLDLLNFCMAAESRIQEMKSTWAHYSFTKQT